MLSDRVRERRRASGGGRGPFEISQRTADASARSPRQTICRASQRVSDEVFDRHQAALCAQVEMKEVEQWMMWSRLGGQQVAQHEESEQNKQRQQRGYREAVEGNISARSSRPAH